MTNWLTILASAIGIVLSVAGAAMTGSIWFAIPGFICGACLGSTLPVLFTRRAHR